MSDRWTSHEPIATQGHNNNGHSVISPGPVATKAHNNRAVRLLPPHYQKIGLAHISTCLHRVHCGGDHGYTKLISGVTVHAIVFFLCRAYCDRACLPLSNIAHEHPRCPTSLTKLGRNHVKKLHTNIRVVQHCGESSHHQPGYQGLVGWF
jgi:hypothetical protein